MSDKATITVCRSEGRPVVASGKWFARVTNIRSCDRRGVNDPRYRSANDWFASREEAQRWAERTAAELGWTIK